MSKKVARSWLMNITAVISTISRVNKNVGNPINLKGRDVLTIGDIA